jgi:putative membrane-bound dehydrogenase-like protein
MNRRQAAAALAAAVSLSLLVFAPAPAQKGETPKGEKQKGEKPPHGQDSVPGPALTPQEAIKKMTVPDGFTVELVASEPEIVNPVSITFDERGRIWITESLEYPRASAGPGKDRIKILESTKGDGVYDKVTVFADGLNIPSGIAVGGGGVWVANSPDILFYKEKDGKADGPPEVVVTGFGRADTHELPNSLTWGPDGWLYGLNGVFNQSHIKYRGKEYKFTCAMFRIHPRTRDFEVFCEGTSNPWGIAFDSEGSAFVSACVIDHLWHLTETGYYHRQGGPYPPFTWKIESIVKHRHQKAAYCGLCWFDSDAYPAEYRGKLFMGNIHGGCINSDQLTRDGSTYFAKPRPDFLTAHDQWFMPVAQKVGPDGCLYILDWYDRYHCYQDAQRDPKGIDRTQGRLYRIRYKDSPRAGTFDLAKESDDKLIERLASPNVYYRENGQRLLSERLAGKVGAKLKRPPTVERLEKLVADKQAPRHARLHALWTLIAAGPLDQDFHLQLVFHEDATFRAWAVRAAGNMREVDDGVLCKLIALVHDKHPDPKLQWAIAARKVKGVDAMGTLLDVLREAGDDKLIPHIVWQNLHPLLESDNDKFLANVKSRGLHANIAALLPRVADRLVGAPKVPPTAIADLLKQLIEEKQNESAAKLMAQLAAKVQSGELQGQRLTALKNALQPMLRDTLQRKSDHPLYLDAAFLAVSLKEPSGYSPVRQVFVATAAEEGVRIKALEALVAGGDEGLHDLVSGVLADAKTHAATLRAKVVTTLGRLDAPWVPKLLLDRYPISEAPVQAASIDVLTLRPLWTKALLHQIGDKKLPPTVLNLTQVRKLQASKDTEVVALVKKHWGTIREDRNPEREQVVAQMKKLLTAEKRGDPLKGRAVFTKNCAVCHKMHGEGQDVGPDITVNGRSDFDQLLSNVFDPNLVIGSGYLATVVTTTDGQVLSGLVVEDNAQRIVLKVQGGETKTIARGKVDTAKLSKVSLMPEQIEKQMTPEEIRDLFAYLTLDLPPEDPKAKLIPGTPR